MINKNICVYCLAPIPALLMFVYSVVAIANEFEPKRHALIKQIEADVRATSLYLDKERLDSRVITAMRTVPRHEFVQGRLQRYAYENRPLPIGNGPDIT